MRLLGHVPRAYVALMALPVLAMALLMAFVPTPYQARSPDCLGSSPAPGIRLDCDDDALAVELYEYALILYAGIVTAGYITWALKMKTRIGQYVLFMLAFLGYGAAVLHYQPIAQVAIMGVGDFDASWATAFAETYLPLMTYTLAWATLATFVAIIRRRKVR